MHINKLINPASLAHDMAEGFIRTNRHPSLPLTLYNYTEKAQFARHWNNATLACRGLIVHDDGHVVARPFPKFFNWNEQPPKGRRFKMDMDELVQVTDKVDGSLGILYPTGYMNRVHGQQQYAIATRGSFTSDQARHANEVWLNRYHGEFGYRIDPRLTYMFEIIYPENRIVVDYGKLDDLVLLGAVDTEGGFIYGPDSVPGWTGPRTKVFPYRSLREAVNERPRAGQEGFVIRSIADNLMVKVKYDDYVSLHRVVTGLNEKEIWRRCMKADLELPPEVERLSTVLQDIPDEMHEWVEGVVSRLVSDVRVRELLARRTHREVSDTVEYGNHESPRGQRKAFALRLHELTKMPKGQLKGETKWLHKAVFQIEDGYDPKPYLWRIVEPQGDVKK